MNTKALADVREGSVTFSDRRVRANTTRRPLCDVPIAGPIIIALPAE
ncbi:MAG TPA: hypothetical protein VK509_07170 [Polyangiales bacterium]|nr:hypothetical protein [Polyangiales bacterium]